MRHRKKINHLSRTSAHRKAMLGNMASSLILKKRINTTLAKAKALRVFVEPLITRSKEDNTHSRRIVFKHLQDKEAVTELFREVSVKVAERAGGYTRILKTGNRLGDNAEMAMIELVDYNENLLAEAGESKSKSRRGGRRRGGKKKTETTAKTEAPVKKEPRAEANPEKTEETKKEDAPKEEGKEGEPKAEMKEEKKEEPKAEDKEEKKEKKEEPKAEKEEKKEDDKKEEEKK